MLGLGIGIVLTLVCVIYVSVPTDTIYVGLSHGIIVSQIKLIVTYYKIFAALIA